jgi:hypothetical protein
VSTARSTGRKRIDSAVDSGSKCREGEERSRERLITLPFSARGACRWATAAPLVFALSGSAVGSGTRLVWARWEERRWHACRGSSSSHRASKDGARSTHSRPLPTPRLRRQLTPWSTPGSTCCLLLTAFSDAAGTPPAEPDVATTVIKIRADTADHLHRGVRYLHGIPDRVVLGGVYNPDAAFSTAMTAYLALLVTSVDIKSRQIVAPGPPPVIVYTFHAIGECVVDGVWSRKVGRPFGLHRGKLRTA